MSIDFFIVKSKCGSDKKIDNSILASPILLDNYDLLYKYNK